MAGYVMKKSDGPSGPKWLYQFVGRKIRLRRKGLKMTQTRLAEDTDLVRTSISNIELGKQCPPLHTLYTLCVKLHCDIRDILPSQFDIDQHRMYQSEATHSKTISKDQSCVNRQASI